MRIPSINERPLKQLVAGLFLVSIAAALGATSAPAQTTAPSAPASDTPAEVAPERVIIRESRRREVMGHVQLEDDEVIVVRSLDDTIESFAKRRVVRIVRLVDPKPGQHGTVVLRNGQSQSGIIVADEFTHVTLEIEGVRTKLERDVVDHVRLEPSFEDRYTHLKAMLRPDAPFRHLAMCQWLVDEQRYDLAEQELKVLMKEHSLHEAQQLMRIVRAQLALSAPGGTAKRAPAKGPRRHPVPELPDTLVTPEEINLIRVLEIDFKRPPKVDVRPETISALLAQHATAPDIEALGENRKRLYKAAPIDIVRLMFTVRARELYPEINVLSEPYALNMFRQRVHNAWLMNNCATSRCHGGSEAGRFFLYRRKYTDPRVRYTNFMILERQQLDEEWALVNYERPLDSLIIQYGLPRTIARKPHPPARGWTPAFRRLDDRLVRGTVEWMEAMLSPRIEYPVEFELPSLAPAPADDHPDRLNR